MSEQEEIKEHFEKLIARIKHNHDIKEHDKNKFVHILSEFETSWLSSLESEDTLPFFDLAPFDELNTKESKPYKKLVHDTVKAIKKMHKEYDRHHPDQHTDEAIEEEVCTLHIIEDEKYIPPSPTEEQRADPLILQAAASRESWENERENIINALDKEHSIVKLCYLAYALVTGTDPYLPQAQEALIQECGRRITAQDMQLNVTDIKPITAFSHTFEHIIKQVPILSVPLRQIVAGLNTYLGS